MAETRPESRDLRRRMVDAAARAMYCRVSSNSDPAGDWDEMLALPQFSTIVSFYRLNAEAALDAALVAALRQST